MGENANGKAGGNGPEKLAQSTYNRYKTQLDPRFDQERNRRQSELASQGFLTGSAGYNEAMGNFNQSRDRAYQDAMDNALQTGYGQFNADRSYGLQNRQMGFQESAHRDNMSLAGRAQSLNEKLGMGNLGIARDQLGLQKELGRGQLDLSRVLGLGDLQLKNDQFGEQRYQNELANQLALQNAPISQLGALSSALPLPQFSPTYNMNPMQAMMNQYNAAMGQYGSDQQANQSLWGTLAGLGGTLGSAFLLASSHDFKENKRPTTPVLDRLNRLVVDDWNYKPEMGLGHGTHTGPYAEDWAREFGGDGRQISVISMMGVMMKAIQELSHKVEAINA